MLRAQHHKTFPLASQSGLLCFVPRTKYPPCFAHSRERTHQIAATPVRSAFRRSYARRSCLALGSALAAAPLPSIVVNRVRPL